MNICYLHLRHNPEVIKNGISQGYPQSIDFDELPSRIFILYSILEDIVNGKESSCYREYISQLIREFGNQGACRRTKEINILDQLMVRTLILCKP